MIPFNIPTVTGQEVLYIQEVLKNAKFSGDGPFTQRCSRWLEERMGTEKVLLTTSCTHSLEMAALLSDIQEGDEVIMPSYTFVSTANAFVLRGAKIVFVDIRPDTMNINENLIESAITERTKAIVPVHYAGVSCEMTKILEVANEHQLLVIEDAAQGLASTYKGQALGTIGDIGCYSFHETKNYHCGEGGALLLNRPVFTERAEILREKGTNRAKFLRGQLDKYTWVDVGSSYLMSELNAAFLYAQLEHMEEIHRDRMTTWNAYFRELTPLKEQGLIDLPYVPSDCEHNAHMFYIKAGSLDERTALIEYLREKRIHSVFHYVPLHSTQPGVKFARFHGVDEFTTKESERLVRLPLFFGLPQGTLDQVVSAIFEFYRM